MAWDADVKKEGGLQAVIFFMWTLVIVAFIVYWAHRGTVLASEWVRERFFHEEEPGEE